MPTELVEMIEQIVTKKLRQLYIGEIAIVTQVYTSVSDRDNYSCDVELKNPDVAGQCLQLKRVPIATGHIGTVALPNVGDMVLVSFIGGSVHQPIITNRMYNDEVAPSQNLEKQSCQENQIIQRLPPNLEDNQTINIVMNGNDPRKIDLKLDPDLQIHVSEFEVSITLQTKNKIAILCKRDEDAQIEIIRDQAKIILKKEGDIDMETPENIHITATKDLIVKADRIIVESKKNTEITTGQKFITNSTGNQEHTTSGTLKMGSTQTEIQANGTMKIEAAGTIDVKGSMINLN